MSTCMQGHPRRAAAAAAMTAAVLLSACGSRAPAASRNEATQGIAGAETSAVGSGDASTEPGAASDSANSPRSATVSGTGTSAHGSLVTTSGTPSSNSDQATRAHTIAATGPGWDSKHVYVGVLTQQDAAQLAGTMGGEGVQPGNAERQANAVIRDINARGGILGRQVVPRFYDVQTIRTNSDPSGVGQAACTFFSQDKRVIAIWNVSTQIDQAATFRDCLAKAKIVMYSTTARAVDDTLLQQDAPYYYTGMAVSWNELAKVFVARLQAQGWTHGWDTVLQKESSAPVVIGILVQDQPQGRRIGKNLQQTFASAGFPKVLTYAYSVPEAGQDSAVNFFKGNKVTHVIVTDIELSAFQYSANTQQYWPRYGITTYNSPYPNLETSGSAPARANIGAMGVGWAPTLDVGPKQIPSQPPGAMHCVRLMAQEGEGLAGRPQATAYAEQMCDGLFLIAEAANRVHGLTGIDLRQGFTAVAGSFSAALSYRLGLGPRTAYAPGEVRDLIWSTACRCLRYGSGEATIGH